MPNEAKLEKFRADVIRGPVSNIDLEKHIIKGYSVISVGELKGHGLEADEKTLEQVAEFGNSHKNGIKSRFGHPNMSQTAFGTYLGRSENFRVEGDRVRADLKIADSAFNSPKGDLGTYVLEMAVNEPDMFGASIVVKAKREFRINEDGTPKKDSDGNELMPLLRVEELLASDVVDEPATGDAMFSFFSDTVKPSAEVTMFLDEFFKQPDALDKVHSFLNRYISNDEEKQKLIDKFSKKVVVMPKEKEEKQTNMPFQLEEENVADTKLKEASEKERLEHEATIKAEATETALKEERLRVTEIKSTCEALRVDTKFADQMILEGISLEDAKTKIIEKASENLKSIDTVKVLNDGTEKFRDGCTDALMVSAGIEKDSKIIESVHKSQFGGMSVQKLAATCLFNDGVQNAYMLSGDALWREVVRNGYISSEAAFSTGISQGSGDFVNVLSNTLNKSAGKGWATTSATYQMWVGSGSLKDFKRADIPRLSEYGDVERVYEGKAPTMSKFNDMKETAQMETWGSQFILSRHVFINDDLAMFTKIPAKFMTSLKRKMNRLAYGLIYNDNGNTTAFYGPTMTEDSAACFNATAQTTSGGHDNLVAAASGAAPSQATLDTAFRKFKARRAMKPDDVSSAINMNINPRYIMTGPKYQLPMYKLFNNIGYNVSGEDSAYAGTTAANIHGPGQPRNLQVVIDQDIEDLDATYVPWYLAADSNEVDTVTLYTLNGQTTPFTDSAPTAIGEARGMHWVIEHDFVFAVGDWRGLYCNSGATK